MTATFPCCGDTNLTDRNYPRPKQHREASRWGACGNRMHAINYTNADGTPGVCLVCPICDSPVPASE